MKNQILNKHINILKVIIETIERNNMSTFSCPIVQIGKIGKLPNSDFLSITHIEGHTVILKTGDFQPGDKAVYIPEESLVPNTSQFEFLWSRRTAEGKPIEERHRVVWAKRLRGIFSMGLLIPITDAMKDMPVGTDVANLLGITKYEQPEPACTGGDNRPQQGWLVKFTEIESIRRYSKHFIDGEQVVATEKVHGSNARYAWHNGEFYIGSHTNVKADDDHNVWSKVSRRLNLPDRLKKYPEMIFFGEVYGTVQRGYEYDLKYADFILFDVFDLNERKYVDWDDLVNISIFTGLKLVPCLYEGPWISLEHMQQFSDGKTIVGNGAHNREGCVIRCSPERYDNHIGRMCLKFVGETYLLSKKSTNIYPKLKNF